MQRKTKRINKTLGMRILFVALAFLVMSASSYVFMSGIVRGNLVRNAEGILNVAETRVLSRLAEFETIMDRFSIIVREMILRGDTADMLNKYLTDMSQFTFLSGGELDGVQNFYGYFETLPEGPALIAGEQSPVLSNENPAQAPWYQLAVAAGGDIVQTTPTINDREETLYTYAKCVLDDGGRRLGVVCMDVKIDKMGQEIIATALNQGGYGMLVNQDLMIMFHPNPDFIKAYVYDAHVPANYFVDDLRNGEDIFERPLTSYRNEEAVAFFHRLPNGWYLGLITPERQYYAPISAMAATLTVLGITLAAVLIGILIRVDGAKAKSDDESHKKSMFLANMSHEIRTPINAIVGMTAIGKTAGTVERKDYCFSKIYSASKHLLGVVNDILDISKIEANKIELYLTDFNFEKMLQQTVNVVHFRADEKRQKLTVHIDKLMPKVLFADDQRFVQVITNLLSNAVKFTPDEGTISLKASFLGENNGLCTIKVEVSDNGIGISPEQQSRLFQTFQQAESSTTRKYGGTGLGLAISKSIVQLMGGEIWVESQLGRGTTFAFVVKVKRGDGARFDLGRYGVNWGNVRILIVDDDPDVLTYFQEILMGFGAQCDLARGAEEALNLIAHKGDYNIYFINWRMPGADGISLTKQIREREKAPGNSVVIMVSSADLSAIEGEVKKAGANKLLLKPLFPSAIADVISECIGTVNGKIESQQEDVSGAFAGRRILFAEDVEINREIVQALLEPTQLEIECAENGLQAVRMFQEEPERYDMIFMDIQMPEMDGYEATQQIRALDYPRAGTIPIVAMTANVFKDDIEHCLAVGMNGHLGKPLDMEGMLEMLLKYL